MGNCAGSKTNPKGLPTSIKDSLQAESLTCAICAIDYNLVDRVPIMLCINQHNACQICFDKIKNGVTIACPFCREEMNVNAVGRNRILIQILKEKEPKTQVKKDETREERVERILKEARENNIQKIIYLIEVGQDFSTVKELHLWSVGLKMITDLSLFTGLKTLDLHKNNISEIKNLQQLKQLTFLNLGYNQISRIEKLDSLAQLEFLDLCHNKIAKIQNLSNNRSLKTLNLNYNTISVVQNLYYLPKLTILYLSTCSLTHNPTPLVSS